MESDPHLVLLSRGLFLAAFSGSRIEQWVVDRVAPRLDEIVVPKGTVLFREGDAPAFVYFMEQGEIMLSRDGVTPIHMVGKWVIGALESGIDHPRTRTATALTDIRFVTAPASTWYDLLEDSFELVRTAFLGTSRGLTAIYANLTEEKLDYPVSCMCIDLPRGRLDLVERLLVLSSSALLEAAGMQTMTDLAESAEERRFPDASGLTAEGADERVHLLLEGTVTARRIGRAASVTVRAGSFIPSAISRARKQWALESDGPLRTLALRPEGLLDEMEEHPDLVRSILGALWHEREWLVSSMLAPDGKIVLR